MQAWIPILWALATGPAVAFMLQAPFAAWVAMLGYHSGCVLAALAGRGGLGTGPRKGRFLAAALLSAAAVALLGRVAQVSGLQLQIPLLWAEWGMVRFGERWLLLYYVVVNPWIEEWFWRGTVLGCPVRAALGKNGARALAVLGFWPLHAVVLVPSFGYLQGASFSLACLAAGALWTGMRERQGSAWDALASHQGASVGLAWLYWELARASGR